MQPRLPVPRGPLSELLCDRLGRAPGPFDVSPTMRRETLADEDLQLALHLCFGLHYDGFEGVDDGWEWEPSLLGIRSGLERRMVEGLSVAVDPDARPGANPAAGALDRVRRLIEEAGGPSLSAFMSEQGDRDHLRELLVHRSIYQRKEADPHTWAIPRLRGRAKAAIVSLQADEYGNGVPGRSHAELFGVTMAALDLDPTPGAYIDQVPGVTLATDNLITLIAMHRRWRGALIGHLAAFEMTSVVPMSRYAAALRRLRVAEEGVRFYDVHVVADEQHAHIAADDLIGGLVESDPVAAVDIAFGAAALMEVERRFSRHVLGAWAEGRSSLVGSSMVGSSMVGSSMVGAAPGMGSQASEPVPLLVVDADRLDAVPAGMAAQPA